MAHDGRLSMIAARIGYGLRQLPWLVSLVCVYSAWLRLSTTCNGAIGARAKRYEPTTRRARRRMLVDA